MMENFDTWITDSNITMERINEFTKDIFDVEVFLSDELPQANKVSGKFNHIYKDFEEKNKSLSLKK